MYCGFPMVGSEANVVDLMKLRDVAGEGFIVI